VGGVFPSPQKILNFFLLKMGHSVAFYGNHFDVHYLLAFT